MDAEEPMMIASKLGDPEFAIPPDRFDNPEYIESRVRAVPLIDRGQLRSVLKYLYLTDGPKNVVRSRKSTAEAYLTPAERIVVRWLFPRSNGAYRKTYGFPAVLCARRARYRCEQCGQGDVRVLEFDHVDGRIRDSTFACLCANCHKIKSRNKDWSRKRRV